MSRHYLQASEATPRQRAQAEAIYDDAFPADLRAPFETLLDDDVRYFVDEHDAVAGVVVSRRLADTGIVFIRYFVAGVRGRGVGTAMFTALWDAEPRAAMIVLDVEHPDQEGIPAAERHIRQRRISFYQRLGGVVLPLRDYLPPHDDGHAPLMDLLAFTRPGNPGLDPTDAAAVRRVVCDVYAHRYHVAADDPVVQRTLTASSL